MALARIACGNCGASVAVGQKQCPQCGAPVEFIEAHHSCPSCGHTNAHPGDFCESCGSRLIPNATPRKAEQRPAVKKKTDPTHIAVGIVAVLSLGYFVYSEVTRPFPDNTKAQAPPAQAPDMDHTDEEEITRLEQLVDAHQHDTLMVLELANRLHDAGLKQPRYLPRAINAYTRYLALQPSDPDARVDRSICYFEMGRLDSSRSSEYFQKAIAEMEDVFKSHPTHQSSAFNLGIVYLFAGDMKRSTQWFLTTVQMNPESDLGKRADNLLKQHSNTTLQ